MHPILLFLATFATVSTAHHVPRSSTGGRRRDDSLDMRLAAGHHPILRAAPVPRSPEEIEAAQRPDYINWLSEHKNGKRSILESRFEAAEHAYLGDCLVLKGPDGNNLPVKYKFTLENGVNVTYGDINCLAGDFYGTYDPISDGTDLQARTQRFLEAYALLAQDTDRQPEEAMEILDADSEEREAFAAAVANGTDPSIAYSTLPDNTAAFELITITRPIDQPGYLGLAAINYDHFGADARLAYNAGHNAAIQVALGGRPQDLLKAYTLNAFADHFLEDSFAAGHMRVPRRILHNAPVGGLADICSKYMHDEDNAIGLVVTNPKNQSWRAYGDKRLMDHVDEDNVNHALNALQISVAEVYNAWKTGVVPSPSAYGAWQEAPTLESARGPQELAPLFTLDGKRRDDIDDRRSWEFTDWYTYAGTALQIEISGMWDYPIVMT